MSKAFFWVVLFCGLSGAHAASPAPPIPPATSAHPLTGHWAWKVPGKSCEETLTFHADGSQQGRSGEEQTSGRYEVAAIPSLLGFYRLQQTTTEANGKRDCSGDLHEASAPPLESFIQFSPQRDQFIVCKEENLKACYGPLKRLAD